MGECTCTRRLSFAGPRANRRLTASHGVCLFVCFSRRVCWIGHVLPPAAEPLCDGAATAAVLGDDDARACASPSAAHAVSRRSVRRCTGERTRGAAADVVGLVLRSSASPWPRQQRRRVCPWVITSVDVTAATNTIGCFPKLRFCAMRSLLVRRLAVAVRPTSAAVSGSAVHAPSACRTPLVSAVLAAAHTHTHTHTHTLTHAALRYYATAAPPAKLDVAMIARLRKESQCTIAKAKEALQAVASSSSSSSTTPDAVYAAALEWLRNDLAAAGAKKAAKVADRVTAEGLVGVHVNASASAAAMVEVNSETDFVAKSALFGQLVSSAARTASALAGSGAGSTSTSTSASASGVLVAMDSEAVLDAAVVGDSGVVGDMTVRASFTETIGKLGENLRLRRALVTTATTASPAAVAASPATVFGVYAHAGGNALAPGLGTFASVVALAVDQPGSAVSADTRAKVAAFAGKVAQHVTGFAPKALHASSAGESAVAPDEALLTQDFLFGGGSVSQALDALSAELGAKVTVADYVRYACGEGIEKKKDNFVEEVMKQAGGTA
ncbi:elongation factor TS-domain-containing protein [Entophlyctis helioformis]|nr:elongation factor TS-domain-containing protein [Entophlyctis helioformis]